MESLTRKRRRPWVRISVPAVAAVLVLSGGSSIPFIAGVAAEESSRFDFDSTIPESPTPFVPHFSERQTQRPRTRIKHERSSIPLSIDIVMQYAGSNLNQLTSDVRDLMEAFLLENLASLDNEERSIQDVLLRVSFTRIQRRRLLRDIVVEVTGNIWYDVATNGCRECAVEDISTQLDTVLTSEALDQAFQDYQVEGVNGISDVTESLRQEEWITRENTTDFSEGNLQARDARGNVLERPSLISIIFGFLLTAAALAGLVFYNYAFCKKRQKRLRKERKEQMQGIQYPRTAYPPVKPTSSSKRTVDRPDSTPAATVAPIPAKQVDESSYKLASAPFAAESADAFARELEMAASLDEQAWEDFQRRKKALDNYEEGSPPRVTSSNFPPASSRAASKTRSPVSPGGANAWNESFPYGDEADEEGMEWTAEMSHQAEEKKDDHVRTHRDPEPTSMYKLTTSALKSLGNHEEDADIEADVKMDDETSEVVDEVARLSRFVQRYEKRKERRMQLESERMSQLESQDFSTASSRYVGFDGSVSTRGSIMSNAKSTPDSRGLESAMPKPRATETNSSRSNTFGSKYSGQPLASAYRGITMAGEMYEDPSLENMARPSISTSESESDSHLEDEQLRTGKKFERLGITPFNAQEASTNPVDYRKDATDHSSYNSNRKGSSLSHRARLSELRKSQAIVDSSQSDVNVGNFRDPGDIHLSSREPQQDRSQNPWLANKTEVQAPEAAAKKPSRSNFSKLRELFETRSNNGAIFPPDEHWQSGVTKS